MIANYLEFSYIYKHLIINKKALCLIAEGCTPIVHITNWLLICYAVLLTNTKPPKNPNKHILRRNLSSNLRQYGDRCPEVFREEVAG